MTFTSVGFTLNEMFIEFTNSFNNPTTTYTYQMTVERINS